MESLKDFFDGKKILITGGTGFLGRFLLAKLMRIGNLGEILVLARPKKQKTNTQRIDEALSGILFEKMDLYDPKFKSKIRIINGDIEVEGLGMLKDDRDYIQQEIHIIIHAAATVRFDESFNKAVNINVRGTRDLLDIAVDAKKLQRFIYVSTAYANCPRKKIDEVFYESPMYYKVAINLANKYPEEMLSHLSSKLIAPWPNTYTFTKAISEGMIKEYQTKLPLSIIRPGIGK
jgi:alcohol-forming fatty acyl-CoA reductase